MTHCMRRPATQDSLQNCKRLLPKPPRKDISKYKQFAGRVLRFAARWDSDRPEEAQRTLILSFYPSDDTVSVWETSGDARNTGLVSGKFLERMRLPKPDAGGGPGTAAGGRTEYYGKEDMQVGAAEAARGRRFVLNSRVLQGRLGQVDSGGAGAALRALF